MRGAARVAVSVAACALMMRGEAAGQGPGYPVLGAEEELRLALSAGPPSVAAGADVYVMGEHGFRKAIEGTNGFACLVVRSAAQKPTLAPHCLNPAAARTVLPALLREGALQAEGLDAAAIAADMEGAWDRGELTLPEEGPAWAYMLSAGQRLGASGSSFKPHFMLYVPFATNAMIGGDPARQEFPFVGPYENHPLSTVVIVTEEFVDPAMVKLPARR